MARLPRQHRLVHHQPPDKFGKFNRQDAKFAKVDLLTRQSPISWRSWRLGGKELEICCLATPERRVPVPNKTHKPKKLNLAHIFT
jgi:hypothetical protein